MFKFIVLVLKQLYLYICFRIPTSILYMFRPFAIIFRRGLHECIAIHRSCKLCLIMV